MFGLTMPTTYPETAVVLLSGGLDSSTVLALAQQQGYAVYAMSFRYGQRHQIEIEAAKRIAMRAGVKQHVISEIDLRIFGGSALTSEVGVPKWDPGSQVQQGTGIPITYVPARNTIFLSFALAWAEVLGSANIFIGVNAIDYSGYPDCRPEYIAAYEKLANLATRAAVEGRKLTIHSPLINLSKADIIKLGTSLGVDYSLTVSCYDPSPSGGACGSCDACILRREGFSRAGIPDPAAC